MAIYSGDYVLTQTQSGQACFDLLAGPVASPRLFELGIQLNIATASIFGIGIASAGSTQVGGLALVAEDPFNPVPCQTFGGVAWTTAPVAPAKYLRRVSLSSNAVGDSIIMTFPRTLGWASSASLAIFNLQANAAASHVWASVHE